MFEGLMDLHKQNKKLENEILAMQRRFAAPIVCICGSTRFKQAWIWENARLTQEGNIVLAVGLWGHHERQYPPQEVKEKLDDLHKRKIDLCDWVWVLDVGGYIGDSTRSEIEYAEKIGRPVRYLSKEFPGYVEPVDPMEALRARLEAAERVIKAAKEWKRVRDNFTGLHASSMTSEDIIATQQGVHRACADLDDALTALEATANG